VRTIAELCAFLGVTAAQTVKTLLVDGSEGDVVAIILRGDHELNAVKAQKVPGIANPLRMASVERVRLASGSEPGSIGPVNYKGKIFVDHAAANIADFVCGANEKDYHFTGVNWGRDLPEPVCVDLRNVVAGDPSPSGNGRLQLARGIEVGHVFQLGRKYSHSMKATVLDEQSKPVEMFMGCYGIGITRVVAAAIEQNNDANGIIWPDPLAPFQVVLIPMAYQKSAKVKAVSDQLYHELQNAGIEALFDDRDARPGVKFADAELLGIPHRVVVGERGLESGNLEYRHRRASESSEFPLIGAVSTILKKF